MRYRRLSYRYTMVTGHNPLWTFVQVWRGKGQAVLFGQGYWRPDADMCETPGAVEVVVDLAGVGEDDFEIQLFEDALVVEGIRQLPPCEAGSVYNIAGIRQGPFRLALSLPFPPDAERLQTRYERGLLQIHVPRHGGAG
jgi:HSP20 family molecular chaperone IbpA